MIKEKTPYIKPNRYKHESGYRCFEVGYILEMTEDNKVKRKKVLGKYSDHIYQDYMELIDNKPRYSINMDLTMDGYIRFFTHRGNLIWDIEDFATSSMALKFIPKE